MAPNGKPFLIVFLSYPFFQNVVNTFMEIGGLGRAAQGLNTPWYENYQRLFTDPYMHTALKNALLRNVLCTCLVLAITGALKVFDLPWVMFGAGMPENQGWLTGTYMYDQTFNKMNVDYGSTIAVLIVVLGVVLSNVANRVFKPSEDI